MQPRIPIERLRAWAEGRLADRERAELERELADDPGQRAFAEDFRAVWHATGAALIEPRPSTLSADELIARAERAQPQRTWPWREVAAAVLILVPAAAFGLSRLTRTTPLLVELHALEARTSMPAVELAHELPPWLIDYAPVANGEIRWVRSLDEARAGARLTGRPLFVFGYFTTCPVCQRLQQEEFKSAEVLALVARTIPVALELSTLPAEESKRIFERSYPLLEVQEANGETVQTLAWKPDFEMDVRAELQHALERRPVFTEPLPWERVRELCLKLAHAHISERFGPPTSSAAPFRALSEVENAPGFAAAGHAGLRRVAQGMLVRAAAPGATQAQFEQEIESLRGTPYFDDLLEVSAAWRKTGIFPTLRAQVR